MREQDAKSHIERCAEDDDSNSSSFPPSPTTFSPEVQAAEKALFSSIYMDEDIGDEDVCDEQICGLFCACDLCMDYYLDSDEASQASELTADFDRDEEDVEEEAMSALSSSSSPCCSRSVSCSSTDTLSLCRS